MSNYSEKHTMPLDKFFRAHPSARITIRYNQNTELYCATLDDDSLSEPIEGAWAKLRQVALGNLAVRLPQVQPEMKSE